MRVGQIQHLAGLLVQHVLVDGLAGEIGNFCLPGGALCLSLLEAEICLGQLLLLDTLRLPAALAMQRIPPKIIGDRQKNHWRRDGAEAVFGSAEQNKSLTVRYNNDSPRVYAQGQRFRKR